MEVAPCMSNPDIDPISLMCPLKLIISHNPTMITSPSLIEWGSFKREGNQIKTRNLLKISRHPQGKNFQIVSKTTARLWGSLIYLRRTLPRRWTCLMTSRGSRTFIRLPMTISHSPWAKAKQPWPCRVRCPTSKRRQSPKSWWLKTSRRKKMPTPLTPCT